MKRERHTDPVAKPLRYSVDHFSQHFVEVSETEQVSQSDAVGLDAAAEVEIHWGHEVSTNECEDFFMSVFSADADAEGMGNDREASIDGAITNTSSTMGVTSEHASTISVAAADLATNNSGADDGGDRPFADLTTNNSDGDDDDDQPSADVATDNSGHGW